MSHDGVTLGVVSTAILLVFISRCGRLCLHDRAKHLTRKPSVISEEKKHLTSVLVSNGYPSSFVRNLAKKPRETANKEPAQEFKSTAVLPYIQGVSEVLRRCLQQLDKAYEPFSNQTQRLGLT